MRWKERAPTRVDTHAEPNPPSQEAQSAQPTPQQISDNERRYMELQAAVLNLGHQTIADSQSNGQPLATPAADRPQPEVKADSVTPTADNTTMPSNTTTVGQYIDGLNSCPGRRPATAHQGCCSIISGCASCRSSYANDYRTNRRYPGYRRATSWCRRPLKPQMSKTNRERREKPPSPMADG